ncbi:hydroxymethylbilane synthase [Brooklawnia cerclae]|uniref:Hydroxymethylbilane synthase n=1 Tax=Brooklawnia cerclae TaxID=349934 RepID=A0ABX0SP35_9ACTN|nr:hydroxymethylbilane synthase [Brooklawnia cerclae]
MSFLVGTRSSDLAMTQARQVRDALARHGLDAELKPITTRGDVDQTPLSRLGGIGVFADAVRTALLSGEIDLAVHSLKDLPTGSAAGLRIACVPTREDPHDALVSRDGIGLDDLPDGARVGTGSPRRAAQVRARRPGLVVVDLRGNVPTRVARVLGQDADLDAVVLANAGLRRLGLADVVSEVLDFAWAPGQGCLAVESKVDTDPGLATVLALLEDPEARRAAAAERSVLEGLGSGCAAPVGVTTDLSRGVLTAVVMSLDGTERVVLETQLPASPEGCRKAGLGLAADLLAAGAGAICDLSSPGSRQ